MQSTEPNAPGAPVEKKSKVNIGIGAALVVAIALIALLLVVVKPAAKTKANEWKRVEGAKLLDEKRAAELLDSQGRLLLETAFLAKEIGKDKNAIIRLLKSHADADTTGLALNTEGDVVRFGWPNREVVLSFKKGSSVELDLSALTSAPTQE